MRVKPNELFEAGNGDGDDVCHDPDPGSHIFKYFGDNLRPGNFFLSILALFRIVFNMMHSKIPHPW